jgi:hypothetical protein
MVSVLASSAVDRGIETRSGKTGNELYHMYNWVCFML